MVCCDDRELMDCHQFLARNSLLDGTDAEHNRILLDDATTEHTVSRWFLEPGPNRTTDDDSREAKPQTTQESELISGFAKEIFHTSVRPREKKTQELLLCTALVGRMMATDRRRRHELTAAVTIEQTHEREGDRKSCGLLICFGQKETERSVTCLMVQVNCGKKFKMSVQGRECAEAHHWVE